MYIRVCVCECAPLHTPICVPSCGSITMHPEPEPSQPLALHLFSWTVSSHGAPEYLCPSFLFPAPAPALHPRCHCLRQDTPTSDRCLSFCVERPALVFLHTCDWPEIPTAQIMSLLCSKTSHCLQDNIQILHPDASVPSHLSCPNTAQHWQTTQQSPTCPVFKASTSAHGLLCLQLSLFLG